MFGDTPYGHPISGTAESMTRITAADIKKMHSRYYRPDNAILVIGGDNDVLSGAMRFFEKRGMRIVGAHEVATDLLVAAGVLEGLIVGIIVSLRRVAWRRPAPGASGIGSTVAITARGTPACGFTISRRRASGPVSWPRSPRTWARAKV